MTTILRRYPTLEAALDAVAAAWPAAVSPVLHGRPQGFVPSGLRASGERWDLQVAPVLAPTGKMFAPPGGAPVEEMAPTGEIDIALHWQGAGAPDLPGDAPTQSAAPALEQPASLAPPLAAAQAAARARVVAYADAITARVTARYPAVVVASWTAREAEARTILAGAADPTPILDGLAADWSEPREQVAAAVVAKADAYRAILRAVERVYTATLVAIAAAPDVAALDAVMAAARAQADAAAAQMGIG